MKFEDLTIDIYADGADIQEMKEAYAKGCVKGFTTNPTLMRKAGVRDYVAFAKEALQEIPDLPLSFEVFADDFKTMEREAEVICAIGSNVYVKIQITNSKGESSIPLIRNLSEKGLQLNITAVFTPGQVRQVVDALTPGTKNIVSVFAGRIFDAGEDALKIMREAAEICHEKPGIKSLWASCREVYNIVQAEQCGADIVTVTNDILMKLSNLGKNLEEFSLETVQMFVRDGQSLGFSIV